VLATNAAAAVQAAEIRSGKAVAWAVQYHPEYPLREVAAIVRRADDTLIDEGFFTSVDELRRCARELDDLDRDPTDRALARRLGVGDNVLDVAVRTRELANWIERCVLPMHAQRGRG
jgi:GMP synthase (glutamine-hydrolysing)